MVAPVSKYWSHHHSIDPAHGSRLEGPGGANRFPTLHQDAFSLLHTFSMCSFHDRFESWMITKNFVDFCTYISMSSTLRGLLNDQFLLLVNMTKWVLRLSLSPLFLHHRLMFLRLFCVTSLQGVSIIFLSTIGLSGCSYN